MNITFENKRVLVTGASGGIGKELVKGFIKCKAEKVYALATGGKRLQELAACNPNIVPVCCDLCDWNATKEVVEKLGPIDILVNCAGIFIGELFVDVKPESFDKTITVNLKSIFNVSQIVARGMIERKKGGVIISISSQASKIALRAHSTYTASKAAIDGLTRVMAMELGDHNIRVSCVNPTVVWTDTGRATWSDEKKSKPYLDRIPLHRFAEVEDVVNVLLWLCSDKSTMVNGHNLPIDGGIHAT